MTIDAETDERRWAGYMAAAHRGDGRVYERLLGELAVVIERYVRRRFGPLGVFSEDCVQECLLAIHLGRHTYDPCRPFRPWLFAIVRNKTIDLLRRSYTAPQVSFETTVQAQANGGDPVDELAPGELLAQLDPSYRDALELTKLRGVSTAEAAVRLGISESALRTRVSRALRATEQLLRKEHE